MKPFEGSYVNNPVVNPAEPTAGNIQMKKDLGPCSRAWNRTSTWAPSSGTCSTDFFIQVLKKMKKNKMAITPENVQKVASTFTFELKGVKGPIQYPKATVMVYPGVLQQLPQRRDEVGARSCRTPARPRRTARI